jgi:hypothetical protein
MRDSNSEPAEFTVVEEADIRFVEGRPGTPLVRDVNGAGLSSGEASASFKSCGTTESASPLYALQAACGLAAGSAKWRRKRGVFASRRAAREWLGGPLR